jgi:excisionase family DNA binding protein
MLAWRRAWATGRAMTADYLTPEQVAQRLQVSVKSVYRWAGDDPTLPVLRVGRTVRFPAARLDAWLRAREQGPGRARRARRPAPRDVLSTAFVPNPDPCAIPCAKADGKGA